MKKVFFFLLGAFFLTLFSLPAFAVDALTVTAENAEADEKGVCEVRVRLSENPGIISLNLKAEYDHTKLRLSSIRDCGLLGDDFSHKAKEDLLLWENFTYEGEFTANGVIAVLEFEVIGGSEGEEIEVSLSTPNERNNAMNMGLENVPVHTVSGTVKIGAARYSAPVCPWIAGGGAILCAAGAGAFAWRKKKQRDGGKR